MTHPLNIIRNSEAPVKKRCLIELILADVYKDIDCLTEKFAEANIDSDRNIEQKDAIISDSAEDIDGHILARFVEQRDSRLRKMLQSYLVVPEEFYKNNNLEIKDRYCYNLLLPESFSDAMLEPLKTQMHQYLVCGALYDWYIKMGMMAQARAYNDDLDETTTEIKSLAKGRSITKRPMQPFGPAKKLLF